MNSSPDIRNRLTEWGLPPLIIAWFKKRGISHLFEWQVECLLKNDVLLGGNLIYSAPTSAGKTLVADFLLLKRVLEYGKKALVIEPFVALTREKASDLKSMLFTTKARVGAFGGTYYTPGGMSAVNVAVCTIEKANNFINKLINENKLCDLGIIVVDEIHYLGDEKRGYQLELLLTKVLDYNNNQEKNKQIQIVGLSATIPNLESIAVWLKASLYISNYRPVPLVEKIKIGNNIYEVNQFLRDKSCAPIEIIDPAKILLNKDFDDLCYICIDSVANGHSTLVFCESKRKCEIMAANLADQIKVSGNQLNSDNPLLVATSKKLRDNLSKPKILDVLRKLKKCPAGLDKDLNKCLSFGIAYHHAGLTSEEREIIEDGFKGGAIKALMATSTLSSGVNLPARRVVIRSPTMIYTYNGTFQEEMLSPVTYRQMIGRAGRKNIDTSGESILICRPENQDIAIKLIRSSLGDISSSLANKMIGSEGEPSGLKKAVLEVIANKTAKTRDILHKYLRSTFWLSSASREQEEDFMASVKQTLRYLVDKKFIEELKPGHYMATRLGNAVLASSLHPDESLEVLQDLIKARLGFCLLNDLHIIYQVTPNDIARTIDLKDWHHFSKVWNSLDEVCQSIGERIGIDEAIISRRCQGFSANLPEEKERVYRRFWVALIINDLIREIPLPEICANYRLNKAVIQQVQRGVAQFAGVMTIFCQELGYNNIAALVKPLESRINFSCQSDLLDLIRLNLTRPIARVLYNAGYKTVVDIAKAEKLDIEFIIRQMKPFKKDISFNSESDKPPSIWVPELAKTLTTLDYASHIVEASKTILEIELDLDISPSLVARKDAQPSTVIVSNGTNSENSEALPEAQELEVSKREAPSEIANFEVKYLKKHDIDDFINRWTHHRTISVNFKSSKRINEQIGARIKRPKLGARKRKDSRHSSTSESEDEADPPDESVVEVDIDNEKHIVTRMYVCFDDNITVHVIDSYDSLLQIKNKLNELLKQSLSTTNFVPTKLYTQNIVLTYRILHSAFSLDRLTLEKHFDWNSFDVVWWMVNNCPNRGLNNCNSSLSLVSKTKWATKYHHFLYVRSVVRSTPSRRANDEEFMKIKDIVKSGKTAILKPLINEVLKELEQRNQLRAYNEIEIPSRIVMAQMMIDSVGLDMKSMRNELSLYEDLLQQLTDIAQKHYAKTSISLTNIKHVARVLYDDLDLKKHLLDYGTISDVSKDPTNSEILNILSKYHPFPKLVQDFRRVVKALEALQSVNTHARFNNDFNMMRVFGKCDFWQLTGRVAMFDPDLFLINRNFQIVVPPHGTRDEEIIECTPRRCFVPSKGYIFLAADYSQIELRLLAHFSNDSNLLEILNRSADLDSSYDVFRSVASKIYHKSTEEVTSENRQHAKQICYGIFYGMGNKSLANKLGVDMQEAEQFRQDFLQAFSQIRDFTENTVKDCQELGYVVSLMGRRRIIDGINSSNSSARSRAERVAINTKIQSSASDIIKLAMNLVDKEILKNFNDQVRLVLEMHDELIYEVKPEILNSFSSLLKFTMENPFISDKLRVKLLVNLKKGTNWSLLENF